MIKMTREIEISFHYVFTLTTAVFSAAIKWKLLQMLIFTIFSFFAKWTWYKISKERQAMKEAVDRIMWLCTQFIGENMQRVIPIMQKLWEQRISEKCYSIFRMYINISTEIEFFQVALYMDHLKVLVPFSLSSAIKQQ